MNRLVYILLLMMAAGTVACHRTPGEAERQLIYIDSLIASAPDSALTLLAALSTSPDPQPAGTSEPSGTSGTSGSSGASGESSPSKLEGVRGSVSESVGARGSSPSKLEGARGSVSASDEASPVPMTAGERAYHALLTAQAMYKAYIPATTDSVINVAWDYYGDLGMFASATDRQRRVRAMLYKGTTAEELGHPDSAMYWYKRTELEAAPDDHYHRGYALMNMGRMYQQNYIFKNAIRHYREMLSIDEPSLNAISVYCTQQLAQLYLEDNLDSAKIFINRISRYVQETNDSVYMLSNMVNKSMMWFYNEEYDSVKSEVLAAIELFNTQLPYTSWYELIISYSKQNKSDSAEYFFSIMPNPSSSKDSIFYYEILRTLNQKKGKWDVALDNEIMSNAIIESILPNENTLKDAEYQAKRDVESNNGQTQFWQILALLMLVLSAVLLFVTTYQKRRKEQFAQAQIKWLNQEFNSAQVKIKDLQCENHELLNHVNSLQTELNNSSQNIDRLKSAEQDSEIMKYINAQFNKAFQNCIQPLEGVAIELYERGENAKSFIERFQAEFESCWKSHDFWNALENHINTSRNSAISRIQDSNPDLTVSELRLIMLLMLHFAPMAIVICMGYKNTDVLYSMKNKLKKKLKKTDYKTIGEYLDSFSEK